MRILYINNYFSIFSGTDSGASNRSTMFIKALSCMGHVDVISFRGDSFSNIENCDLIHTTSITSQHKEGRLDKFFKLLAFRSPEKIYPVNKEKEEIVDSHIKSGKYDYVACRYLREAIECGLLKYSERLIIDIDDNPRDVALMAAKTAKTLRNRIYNSLYADTLDRLVKYTLRNVKCCFHSNPLQSPVPQSVYLHNVTVSNVDLPLISEDTPLYIMMVGLFHYGPNIEGLEHFLNNVWPIVYKENPNITLNVIGRIGDEQLKQKWSNYEGVVLKGFVPDLADEYLNARLVIVPIYSGSGTSVKVVEAMQMNRACISTLAGVRGYDQYLTDGKDYILTNTDEEFAEKILNHINNILEINNIAKSARSKINLHFSRDKFQEIVINAIKHK